MPPQAAAGVADGPRAPAVHFGQAVRTLASRIVLLAPSRIPSIVAAVFAPITPRIEVNFQPSVPAPAPQSPIPPATGVHCVVPFMAPWPALAA